MLKVAYLCPLKPPDHPRPSGDRLIAGLLLKAMRRAGFDVRLVGHLQTRDASGDLARQRRMRRLGVRLAQRHLAQWRAQGYRPDLVFCYHSYYKAPDLVGPHLSEALQLPYWVAEASWAPKRAQGPWAEYHRALEHGLARASGCFVLNPRDELALKDVLAEDAGLHHLRPFLDLDESDRQRSCNTPTKRDETEAIKLVCVAMLRAGDKLHSLVLLAHALHHVRGDYTLHIIGDGAAFQRARTLFVGLPVVFEGQLQGRALQAAVSACDLMVWPSVNEAIGMAMLEAQSCGVAVLSTREGGVPSIVADGLTGELVEPRDTLALSAALQKLLDNPGLLKDYGRRAHARAREHHGIDSAAKRLASVLGPHETNARTDTGPQVDAAGTRQ